MTSFINLIREFDEFEGGRFQGDPTRIVLKDVNEEEAGAFDFDGLDALAERVAHARGAATAADRALETENEATASDARAANKALFDAALREADETLASSLRASETDASLTIFGAAATRRRYLAARDAFTAERTPRELNDYATIVRNKIKTIGATLDGYAKIFAFNQERIDLYGGTVSGNVFADSTFDYEICFDAGTPVVMADGRVRPIETLRPGDEVLAADHLLPEGKLLAARVVRFFDNGEKTVARLRFDGFELVCTPEHPFYIVGKGWTRASALTIGDFALNASGGRVAFLGRETVDGARRVYNIEVEGAHTYFVGNDGGVLAHNKCGYCSGSGVIRTQSGQFCGMSVIATSFSSETPCPYCFRLKYATPYTPSENAERNKEKLKADGLSSGMIDHIANFSTLTDYLCVYGNLDQTQRQQLIDLLYKHGIETFEHYVVRYYKNSMHEFITLDWDLLSKAELKILADGGTLVTRKFLGENWELLSSSMSKYHAPGENGKICFKWRPNSGRELVIRDDHVLEYRPEFWGTFNFALPYGISLKSVPHLLKDMRPYDSLKNVPNLGNLKLHIQKE